MLFCYLKIRHLIGLAGDSTFGKWEETVKVQLLDMVSLPGFGENQIIL